MVGGLCGKRLFNNGRGASSSIEHLDSCHDKLGELNRLRLSSSLGDEVDVLSSPTKSSEMKMSEGKFIADYFFSN